MRILRQTEQYNFSSRKSGTGAAVPFDKVYLFSWESLGANSLATTNMAAEFAVVLELLLDDTYAFHFIEEEEDDDLPMFSMAALITRRSLNQCHGYFEQTVPFYSIDEFQSHFHMKRTTFEILVREVVGTGVLPVGNPFGRQVIDARKQVSIFLWCIANQETTRLIADRFNVTYSSVSRVVRRVTESVLALRNQYIKWPNGKIASSFISVIKKTFCFFKMILISSQKVIQLIFLMPYQEPVERNNGKFQSRRGIPRSGGCNRWKPCKNKSTNGKT